MGAPVGGLGGLLGRWIGLRGGIGVPRQLVADMPLARRGRGATAQSPLGSLERRPPLAECP